MRYEDRNLQIGEKVYIWLDGEKENIYGSERKQATYKGSALRDYGRMLIEVPKFDYQGVEVDWAECWWIPFKEEEDKGGNHFVVGRIG